MVVLRPLRGRVVVLGDVETQHCHILSVRKGHRSAFGKTVQSAISGAIWPAYNALLSTPHEQVNVFLFG
jgi:hypothetical protein